MSEDDLLYLKEALVYEIGAQNGWSKPFPSTLTALEIVERELRVPRLNGQLFDYIKSLDMSVANLTAENEFLKRHIKELQHHE